MKATVEQHAYRLAHTLMWDPQDAEFGVIHKAMLELLVDFTEGELDHMDKLDALLGKKQ